MNNMQELLNIDNINKAFSEFFNNQPFDYFVCDNFFIKDVAIKLSKEFPNFNSDIWHKYNNAIENKKTLNTWNAFPLLTYQTISLLNSNEFLNLIQKNTHIKDIFSDSGLNGGGWHIHNRGGKLNVHLDYSIHPKLKLQRKYNLIVFLEQDWQADWGGGLELWSADIKNKCPDKLIKKVSYKFNRAVFFDTTQNSWHGLPDPINCPTDKYRKSLAAYYLTTPSINIDKRGKALFSPTEQQKGDKKILALIKDRANINSASSVYE